jgi:STE24 endopeptidase
MVLAALVYILIVGGFFFSFIIETLNLKNLRTDIPPEFQNFYDQEKYKKSQEYLKTNTKAGLIQDAIATVLLVAFIALGGFNYVDLFARHWLGESGTSNSILQGLLYIGILSGLSYLLSLPFQIYHTFVIEENFGFNKTTPKTFLMDQIKGLLMGAILGGIVLSVVLWFFENFNQAWIWVLIFVVGFQLFMMFIAPVTIMPLFNKFEPLEEGDLKSEIESFAKKENFKLSGLFKMDGSKRSTNANAYFTGFGRFRRIVLFDTLIQRHTKEELVAVLAHEIGHYKEKHIFRTLLVSIISTALTFYVFSLFMENPEIFKAFKMENISIYASFVFFGIFYAPISALFSLYSLYLSRKHEFEADDYAKRTYGHPKELSNALKKLSVDNLSNLHPHPLKVFFEYTHPPVLQRVKILEGTGLLSRVTPH